MLPCGYDNKGVRVRVRVRVKVRVRAMFRVRVKVRLRLGLGLEYAKVEVLLTTIGYTVTIKYIGIFVIKNPSSGIWSFPFSIIASKHSLTGVCHLKYTSVTSLDVDLRK